MASRIVLAALVGVLGAVPAAQAQTAGTFEVRSADGAAIAVECAGSGPKLLIVHGGTGDRTRWTPMIPYLQDDLTVCAMDRRAHGESGDGPEYSLAREAEDVVAVVDAMDGDVAVLGHSFGAVVSYEAAFLTPHIAALVLYEPPLQISDHSETLEGMERLIAEGDPEAAAILFQTEINQQSAEEIEALRARPAWNGIVESIGGSIRQDRALSANGWDAARAARLQTPTLLLIGSLTTNEDLTVSVRDLAAAAPNAKVLILDGQEHNAMDTDRENLARIVLDFVQRND